MNTGGDYASWIKGQDPGHSQAGEQVRDYSGKGITHADYLLTHAYLKQCVQSESMLVLAK